MNLSTSQPLPPLQGNTFGPAKPSEGEREVLASFTTNAALCLVQKLSPLSVNSVATKSWPNHISLLIKILSGVSNNIIYVYFLGLLISFIQLTPICKNWHRRYFTNSPTLLSSKYFTMPGKWLMQTATKQQLSTSIFNFLGMNWYGMNTLGGVLQKGNHLHSEKHVFN